MHETRRFLDQMKANVDRLTADADLHTSARSCLSELTRKRREMVGRHARELGEVR